MSRTKPRFLEAEIVALSGCAYCGVEPEIWCMTKTAHWATDLHAARSQPVYDIWSKAYAEGNVEAYQNLSQRITTIAASYRLRTIDEVVEFCRKQAASWSRD